MLLLQFVLVSSAMVSAYKGYLGSTKKSWSASDNVLLLEIRSKYLTSAIDGEDGEARVMYGSWPLITQEAQRKLASPSLTEKVCKHQVANLLQKRKDDNNDADDTVDTVERKIRKWTEYQNDVLLTIRAKYVYDDYIKEATAYIVDQSLRESVSARSSAILATNLASLTQSLLEEMVDQEMPPPTPASPATSLNPYKGESVSTPLGGRVVKGSWPEITKEASAALGFPVKQNQCEKRCESVLRKRKREVERGVSVLGKRRYQAVSTDGGYGGGDTMKVKRGAWDNADSAHLMGAVESADRSNGRVSIGDWLEGGRSSPRPRGFWVKIASSFSPPRDATQCRERFYWLEKADSPLFG